MEGWWQTPFTPDRHYTEQYDFLLEHCLGSQRQSYMAFCVPLLLNNLSLMMKTQGNLNRILMDSISKASSLTWENNALKWGLHYVNTRTFIHFTPPTQSQSYAQCLHSYQSLSILKRAPSLYLERIFQKQLDLMRYSKKQSSSKQALQILTLNGLFPTCHFCAFGNFQVWHDTGQKKHDQITK